MKTICNLFFLTFLSLTIYAQSAVKTISGTVQDTRNEVIPGATVRLLKALDSTIVKGEITNSNGKFEFNNLENNVYLLSIMALGQREFTSVPLTIDDVRNILALPVIILLPAENVQLNEVVIKTKRPLIEQEIDKTVVNVEVMISSATSNTLEVLEKTPGVSVSNTGEISLNGRGGVLVLIDGRSTYMSGQDLAAYLKSLPGGLLDKIELIDNPPAKYDAAGNAVINIRLKKNRVGGLTGNVVMGVSQGKYARNNDAANLNYNYKKVNLFANLGYNFEKNYTRDNFDRRFYNETGQLNSSVDLLNNQIFKGNGVNATFGLDFTASTKTTYGVIVNLNQTERNGDFLYSSNNYDSSHDLDNIGTGKTISSDRRRNSGINLNLTHKFNNTGTEFSVDANYLNYHSNGKQSLRNSVFEPNGVVTSNNQFLYVIPSDINIYSAKADYIHPLKSQAKLEAGFKSSLVDNDYVFDYYNVEDNVNFIDNGKSNHFKYHENINAAYVNSQKTWRRFGAQLGVRIENTRARGQQLGNDTVSENSFAKNYTGLFPSFYINYKLDSIGKNTLGLMIVRRINRPNYQQLNPFVFFRDQYSYTSGNPMLNPQYQNRIELKFQHKQFLNMGLSYNKFTNVIFQTTQAADNIFTTRPENIAEGYMVLLNTTVSFSPVKWWYTNTTLRLSHMTIEGPVYTENLNFDANIARLELNNYFTISKNISAEFGGYYASRDLNGQTVTAGMYRVNAAVQKKIWKGKGSIRLAVDDLFHSWVYHNRSLSLKQSEYFQTSISDTQRASFAITYRFGKETFARKRKYNNNGSDDEKARVE